MSSPEDGLDAFAAELDGFDPESFTIESLIKAQQAAVLDRIQALEPLFDHFELNYSVSESVTGGWQSFHLSQLNNGNARMLLARSDNRSTSTNHIIVNNETRDAVTHEDTLLYWEFAFNSKWSRCNTRYGSATRRDLTPWGTKGNLGKCALLVSNADSFTIHRKAGSLIRPQAIPGAQPALDRVSTRLRVLLPLLESFSDGMHYTAATGKLQ